MHAGAAALCFQSTFVRGCWRANQYIHVSRKTMVGQKPATFVRSWLCACEAVPQQHTMEPRLTAHTAAIDRVCQQF